MSRRPRVVLVVADEGTSVTDLEACGVQLVLDMRGHDSDPLTRAIRNAGLGYLELTGRRSAPDIAALAGPGGCALLCPDLRTAEGLGLELAKAGVEVETLLPGGIVSPFQPPLGW